MASFREIRRRTRPRFGTIAIAALAGCVAAVPAAQSSVASSGLSQAGAVSSQAAAVQVAPVGDLPGWRQTFRDDFSTNVSLGNFPAAVSTKWTAYPSPWKDTTGHGTYNPGQTVSVSGGVLNEYIHTAGGVPLVAALVPKLAGTTGAHLGQKYGMYAVRFRADNLPGYKIAWMLWPDSGLRTEGEIDLPERNLDSSDVFGFMHHINPVGVGDQDWARALIDGTQWHTTVIEWKPNLVIFYLDGVEIKRTTTRVPRTPLHWVLQTETALHTSSKPSATVRGNVQIDWVAAWAYDPSAGVGVATTAAVGAPKSGAVIAGVVTLQATAVDPRGISAVKWYVDGTQVGYDGTGSPWADSWDTKTVSNGQHRLFVKALNAAGTWGTSKSVLFTVKN